MITLNKFYNLLGRNASVILVDMEMNKSFFEGYLKNIPDEYDNCEVVDFDNSDENILFKIKK